MSIHRPDVVVGSSKFHVMKRLTGRRKAHASLLSLLLISLHETQRPICRICKKRRGSFVFRRPLK